jgi:hypothetical protein
MNFLKPFVFKAFGEKPWSRGYFYTRNKFIQDQLSHKDFDLSQLPSGYGVQFDERVIEYPWVFSKLNSQEENILDAGSILNFEFLLTHERLKHKKITIVTLAPEDDCFWKTGTSYVFGDLRDTCFRENYFDSVICVSTLEHIGMNNNVYKTMGHFSAAERDTEMKLEGMQSEPGYLLAIRELKRVLKPGGQLLLTVPYGGEAQHGWLQVFDSRKLDAIKTTFSPTKYAEEIYQWTNGGWAKSDRDKTANCRYSLASQNEGTDLVFAAAEAVACLQLIK